MGCLYIILKRAIKLTKENLNDVHLSTKTYVKLGSDVFDELQCLMGFSGIQIQLFHVNAELPSSNK